MLPKGMVLEVERLLRERKLTQRAIAKLLGVSRGTVGNIARGRHPLHGRAGASCTASRRSFTSTLDCLGMVRLPWFNRPLSPSLPRKPLTSPIPRNYELYIRSKLSTASRRSFTSTFECLATASTPYGLGSISPNLPK